MKMSAELTQQTQARIEKLYVSLTDAEQMDLILKAKRGNIEAQGILVKNQTNTIFTKAFAFAKDESQVDDLIGEGVLGVYKAIKHFDPKGAKSFNEVVAVWVHVAILHHANCEMV